MPFPPGHVTFGPSIHGKGTRGVYVGVGLVSGLFWANPIEGISKVEIMIVAAVNFRKLFFMFVFMLVKMLRI